METDNYYESISKIGAVPSEALRLPPGKILIHPLDLNDEYTSKTGLIMPETADPVRQVQGVVVAAGAPVLAFQGGAVLHEFSWSDGSSLKPGQRVLYTKYGGTEWKDLNGKVCLLIEYSHLHALIDENHPGVAPLK